MRSEDVIALMKEFSYDEEKTRLPQPQSNLRLPHTTRDENLCLSIEAALFAFGRLSEEGDNKLYNPNIYILNAKHEKNPQPLRQGICLYRRKHNISSALGFLSVPRKFIEFTGSKGFILTSLETELEKEDYTLMNIQRIDPKKLRTLRRKIRDSQGDGIKTIPYSELFPSGSFIRYKD